MAYRCKSCGRYVSKDAHVCKYCGEDNPSVEDVKSDGPSARLTVFCPNCGSQCDYERELDSEEYLCCGCCGAAVVNPYYDKYGSFFKKNKIKIVFYVLCFLLVIWAICRGAKNSERKSVPKMTEEWEMAAKNQNFEIGEQITLPQSFLLDVEKSNGKTLVSLFEKYHYKPIGKQEILYEEPLKSLIIQTLGKDKWEFMTTCRKSDEGLVKEVSDHIEYYYDCYKDIPNGDYFALSYDIFEEGKQLFYLDVQIDGIADNLAIHDPYSFEQ